MVIERQLFNKRPLWIDDFSGDSLRWDMGSQALTGPADGSAMIAEFIPSKRQTHSFNIVQEKNSIGGKGRIISMIDEISEKTDQIHQFFEEPGGVTKGLDTN